MMPLETGLEFEEAKASFVYENFVAVIMLASAFVDHCGTACIQPVAPPDLPQF
jgi:hypothetical protein